jgi:hypothetical protein
MIRRLLPLCAAVAFVACSDSSVSVEREPPEATIVEPSEGTEIFHDEAVEFCGRAYDRETTLQDLDLGLTSDLDGKLWSSAEDATGVGECESGEGVAVTLEGLSVGTHALSFWAVDAHGLDGSDTRTLTVIERPNDPPACVIDAPLDGTIVLQGEALLFAGSVSDADQDAETLELNWESDEDGSLFAEPAEPSGATGFDTADLTPGDHLVSLSVTDLRGESDVCFVLVGIEPCHDGDGDGVENCDNDCDDHDAEIYPGADELPDGEDNDCDGTVDEGTVFYDDDGDGYCEGPASCTDGSIPGDCDDTSDTVYPGAPEDGGTGTGQGNGIDDDCDGLVDNGTDQFDDDGDGYSELDGDCDDADPAVRPGAIELCNGIDDDCNGTPDDADLDVDGYVDTACGGDDCDDADPYVHPGATEICDGVDQDCDGTLDDRDIDGDGQIDDACGGDDCNDLDPVTYLGAAEIPDNEDNDCDAVVDEGTVLFDDDGDGYSEADGDCDDADPATNPDALEACGNAADEDCSGLIDDADLDLDGFVDDACGGNDCDDDDPAINPLAAEICGNGVDDDCNGADQDADEDLDGFVDIACGGTDCDDADPATNPAQPEDCNNNHDDDCSGLADDADEDYDGFIADACGGDDCDDADPAVHPGATETCDGIDQDCDGTADDRDIDGDGHLDPACAGDDCDDLDALTYPGATEVYDLKANDCDGSGIVDEGLVPAGAIVVVEAMIQPTEVAQDLGEWFEVYNAWHLPVNLDTWTFGDLSADLFEVLEPGGLVIAPGEVAVLCADDDAGTNGGVICDTVFDRTDFQLDDGHDEITAELGADVIDEVAYDAAFPLTAGAALSLDPVVAYAELNDLHGNWCAATAPYGLGDLGSPGDENPPCSSGPAIADISPDEATLSGAEEVVITGSGFTAATAVTVGGNPCASWLVVDDGTLDCTVPPGAVGFADVVVEHGGDVDTLVDGFLYTGQAVTELSWCNLQFPIAMTLAPGEAGAVFGRFHAFDLYGNSRTDPAGSLAAGDPDYAGQVGYGPVGTDPRIEPGWTWFDADYHADIDTNEEYEGDVVVSTPGDWSYAIRFTDDGGFNYLYCDGGTEGGDGYTPGTADGFQIDDLGELTVN